MTILKSLRGISVAAWIAIVGLVASIIIFGWSIPRGFEMGADEGSHFLETARPWDCGYFHTLYAWYAHAVWKLLGASVVRMRWFALVAQLGCTTAFVFAARGWFSRAGARHVPPLQIMLPLTLTWSLLCYTLGSITITYTSLSGWVSTFWLALVLHLDNREHKPSFGAVLVVLLLALIDCTAKPSTGTFLLGGSLLLTVGWRLSSRRTVRRIHLAGVASFIAVSALLASGLLGFRVEQDAWNLTLKSSPVANFISWAVRYLSSDALRGAVVAFWSEPLREMIAALSFYSCAVACAVGFVAVGCLSRLREWSHRRKWVAGVLLGFLIAHLSGGLPVEDHLSTGVRSILIAFAVMVGLSSWNREFKAAGPVLLGVLVAQIVADAWGIVIPGETFFWAADHEFRLIFVLLLAALMVWFYARDSSVPARPPSVSINGPLIFLFIVAMPVIGWFGSGCFLGARASYHYGMWVVLILLMVAAIGQSTSSRRALAFTTLIMTLLVVNAVFVCRVLRPINAGDPSLSQGTKAVKIGPRGEALVFERKAGGFVSRVKSSLKENGFKTGDPIFAFYNFPGLVFLVGGSSPGTSWYVAPSRSAHVTSGAQIQAYNEQRIRDIPLEQTRRAFIFQTDGDTSFVEMLAAVGVGFPADYVHCAELTIPMGLNGSSKLDIWKPKSGNEAAK